MALFSDDSSEITIYNRLDHTSQEYSNEYSSSHHVGNTATLIQEYSKNTFPVLIIGETGTGKDKIARQLYENSPNNTMGSCRRTWNKEKTAKRLGISRSTLWRMLKK